MNLVHDPWLPVLQAGGHVTQESLLSLFDPAQASARDLAVTAPGQHPALTRFLIAVATLAWNGRPDGPLQAVQDHLLQHAGRFNLSGDQPFMQAPLAAMERVPERTIAILRAGVPSGNNVAFSGAHMDARPEPLTAPQVARTLITAHHDAISSGKSPFGHTLDSPSSRPAHLILHAQTLHGTLRANVTPLQSGDTAFWQEEDPTTWGTPRARPAPGLIRATCWPWRAIHVTWAGDTARYVRLAAGDTALPCQDPMTVRLTIKGEQIPAKLTPAGPEQLLLQALHPDHTAPENLRAYLAQPRADVTHLRVTGQVTNQSAVLDTVDARLPITAVSPDAPHLFAYDSARNALLSAIYTLNPGIKPGAAREHLDATGALRSLPHGAFHPEPDPDPWAYARRLTDFGLGRLPVTRHTPAARAAALAVLGARRRDHLTLQGEPA